MSSEQPVFDSEFQLKQLQAYVAMIQADDPLGDVGGTQICIVESGMGTGADNTLIYGPIVASTVEFSEYHIHFSYAGDRTHGFENEALCGFFEIPGESQTMTLTVDWPGLAHLESEN
jgi:hypothetical protein